MSVNVKALGCHAYATSGHKWLMCPKGTGMLYVSREPSEAIQPIQWQDARRYGAESAGVGPQPLVIGLRVPRADMASALARPRLSTS